jgi:tetratricopeptide (TPR) repeat protein
MKKLMAFMVLSCCACVASPAGEKSNLVFDVTFGPHAVGFHVVQQYDYTRSYKRMDMEGNLVTGERARPIQTLIWYPAQIDKSAKPMAYGSYLDLLATEEDFNLDPQYWPARVTAALKASYNLKNYPREKVQLTRAYRDAHAEPGHFPVVVYAPSLSAPAFENSDLCEYLASHGYIVVASPDMGAHSRNMSIDLEGVLTQVADIEFLIGYLKNIPEADLSHIAVAGFSWGGLSNVFAVMLDDRISAVVCLDGAVRYQAGVVKKARDAKLINPNNLTAPLLYLSSKPYTMEELDRLKFDVSYNFLNELRYNDFYFVQSPIMIHPDFSSWFIRFREDHYFTENTTDEVGQSYSWMARYTLQFLNAYLKDDASAMPFLKNDLEKNGVPRHLLTLERREALHPAANVPDFSRELAAQGFDKATDVYEKAKKNDPAFKLDEDEVNHWGYALLDINPAKAVAVFKINAAMYPDSANTYDSLAEAQEAAGDQEGAIANYRKSLQLNNDNWHAKSRLKELEAAKP